MPPYNFMGLSGLGQTQPSQSSSVDNAQVPNILQDLLGGGDKILDETAKSRVLEQMLSQTQAQPTESALDKLLSPQGLAALAGVIGAGALGGAPAAAGFGLGSLQGAGVAAEADKAQKRKAIEELEGLYEGSQERLEKSRNRIATLFNTNPEAFVDPVTGEQKIAPDLLGFYTTGTPIQLFATTRRTMDRRDNEWAKRHDVLSSNLEYVMDPQARKSVIGAMFQNMNWAAPPEVVDALANASPDNITPEAASLILKYGGASGLDALIAAGDNGWSPFDARTLRMVEWKDPEASARKVTPSDRFVQLADEINAWSSDPANLDRMREIRAENESKGEDAVALAVAREVIGGRQGDLTIYRDEAEIRDPNVTAGIMAEFKSIKDKYKLGVGLSGIDKTSFIQNMTDEEQNQYFWGMAEEAYGARQQKQKDDQARVDLGLLNGVTTRLQKEYQVGPSEAAQASKDIGAIAMRRATRPDGSVDRVRYEQELRKVTEEVMAGALPAGE